MLVGEHMTAPAVVVPVDATLDEIQKVLERRAISAVPVVEGARVVGVVSSSDVVRALASHAERSLRADRLMSSCPLVASASEPVVEAARRLVAARVHRLVVVDGERPVGVLGARDMLVSLRSRKIEAAIGTIMTSPVETVDIGDPIPVAAERLATTNVHGLVVVDGRAPVGVFTHREALATHSLPGVLRARPVEEVMSYETICLDVGTPIFRAVGHALAMDVRRFLVVEHRSLVGVVSCVDLVGVLARASDAAQRVG